MQKSLDVFLLLIFIIIFSCPGLAIEAGGNVELMLSGIWQDESFDSDLAETVDLELFLPRKAGNEYRYAFQLTKPVQGLLAEEEISYFTKKLYLRHRFEDFNLTIGRQPVSWSFGSLFNPVDYTLGAVSLDEESSNKYTDAIEAYIPINWNSGLSVITSFPDGFTTDPDKIKYGIRGRFGVNGYDLTLNYVQEAENNIIPIPAERFAFTLKGDLGQIGIYAAYGHYFAQGMNNGKSYLMGIDYSYNIDYFTKLNMQLEYIKIENMNISSIFGPYFVLNSIENNIEIVSTNFVYPVDDFSSLHLSAITKLDDNGLIIIPSYKSTLTANIDLTLSGQFFPSEDLRAVSAVFSYPF